MSAMDVFSQAVASAFSAPAAKQAGKEPAEHGGAHADRYAQMLALARKLAARLNAEREEIERLEALAEGRARPGVTRAAKAIAYAVILAAFCALTIYAKLPANPQSAVLPGFTLFAAWCGERAGMAWRRVRRGKGLALAADPVIVLLCMAQAALAALAAQALAQAPIAPFLGGAFAIAALAGFFGSSGDPVADRIHGELVAARIAARGTEQEISRLEQAVRKIRIGRHRHAVAHCAMARVRR